MSEIKNINTLAGDINEEFYKYCKAAEKVNLNVDKNFQEGFTAAINLMAYRFIQELENGNLDYKKQNRKSP